jgi:chloramphenicol 3-O-phosphotransferase
VPTSDEHGDLFRALVGDGALDELVTTPTSVMSIAAQIAPLRDVDDLEVVSIAVNGERVDVVARSGDREWRIVFGSPDARRIDWLNVFRRPVTFPGIAGGIAVIVNGPSSSGKSTLLAELAALDGAPWVVFDEPMFGVVDVEYLIWRDRAEALHRGFLDGIAALARAGNCVGLSAAGHPASWFDTAFVDVTVLRVGLDCDESELTRRERARNDVPGGHSAASPAIHDGWIYDLRFDTSSTDPGAIADAVLLRTGRRPR